MVKQGTVLVICPKVNRVVWANRSGKYDEDGSSRTNNPGRTRCTVCGLDNHPKAR